MTADAYGSILGLIQQGTGNNNNSWGTTFNNSFATPDERAIAGVNVISTTTGTLDLSTVVPPAGLRLDVDHIQLANGTLTGDITVQVPNVSKTWIFWNNTTGAFNMFVKVPGGVARTTASAPGGLVQIPQGTMKKVICDGSGHLMRLDDLEIGAFVISGKATAGPGELACDGSSLLIAEFPDLYGKIGKTWGSVDSVHFTLPLLTDTNRYLRAAGGTGPAVGTYQANQNLAHTHPGAAFSGTTGTESANHTHSFSGSGSISGSTSNTGAVGAGQPNNGVAPGTGSSNVWSGGSTASLSVSGSASVSGTTGIESASHTHSFSGTTGTIPSSGGTEARPESAAVLICIRY